MPIHCAVWDLTYSKITYGYNPNEALPPDPSERQTQEQLPQDAALGLLSTLLQKEYIIKKVVPLLRHDLFYYYKTQTTLFL